MALIGKARSIMMVERMKIIKKIEAHKREERKLEADLKQVNDALDNQE